MAQKLEGQFIEAGIDWITITAKDEAKIERLRSWAYAMLETEIDRGMIGRPWYQSGYVGVACGHIQFGDRQDSAILRLGGYVAKGYWQHVMQFADNITRLDVQCTFRAEEKPAVVVHRHYQEIQRKRRPFKRAPSLSRITNADGGYTVYSGRRCSNVMGRIYDKASESKLDHYAGCVRYEVQFNGKRARWVANAIASSSLGLVDIARTVLEFFNSRGASVRLLLEKLSSTLLIKTSPPPDGPTDIARKLEWLLRSVRPSVRLLVNLGLRDRVLGLLGFNEAFSSELVSTA